MRRRPPVKVVVMDMDGTWVDVRHLQPFLRSKPRNWKAFNIGVATAPPIQSTEELLISLLAAGHDYIVATARAEDVRSTTLNWILSRNIKEPLGIFMRPLNDYREDVIVKVEMLRRIQTAGFEPWIWYDDKRTVCEALRDLGVTVHQVATCSREKEEGSREKE